MRDDPLRRAVTAALGRRPTPAQRRRVAAALRALADEQERVAAAAAEQEARPAAERLTPRAATAGPGRAPATFVRIERATEGGKDRLRVYIGRGLWYALGSPARADLRADGDGLAIVPGGAYAVTAGKGMPRFYADGRRDLLDDYADGRYAAEVRDGAIRLGRPLPPARSDA